MTRFSVFRRILESWSIFWTGVRVLGLCVLFLGNQEGLAAQEGASFQLPQDAGLVIRLKRLEQAQAPFASHGQLFFTYKGDQLTEVVALALGAEGYSRLRVMEKNAYNVFIYALPIPTAEQVSYRFWVDGLWQKDPSNAEVYYDNYEVAISVYHNTDYMLSSVNPVKVGDAYDFYVSFDPGEYVYIIGSFNNWNPFLSPLREIEPGRYYIRLEHLQPGDYQYYFWVGGAKRLDLKNHRIAANDAGERVSIFTVPAKS